MEIDAGMAMSYHVDITIEGTRPRNIQHQSGWRRMHKTC